MTTVAIVQARMTSSRLPGKVLRPILGRPMLSYQLERMRRAKALDELVVATTINAMDDPIVALCAAEGVKTTRGSELDVLARYQDAASQFHATTIVRLTSDCPLIDPEIIDEAVDAFFAPPARYDLLSNMIEQTYPYGMAVEVMTAEALKAASVEAEEEAEREHVTPFIYWRPERFRLGSMTMTPNLSRHRWTVDTPEDFELVSRIFGRLYEERPSFTMKDVLALLAENPDWEQINRHVEQVVVNRDAVEGASARED